MDSAGIIFSLFGFPLFGADKMQTGNYYQPGNFFSSFQTPRNPQKQQWH